jgi:hypothetical protein
MKGNTFQEKVLTASISLAVVVAVATSTGLVIGIVGQCLTCYILTLLYDTVLMQSLGTLWEALKRDVKLGILGGFFILCIFSEYLRFLAGSIVALRCLVLLGFVRSKNVALVSQVPRVKIDEESPEKLMSPPKTTVKSHLKPRFAARTPAVLTPIVNRFASWMTPVASTSRTSPTPFFTAKIDARERSSPSTSMKLNAELKTSSPHHLQQNWKDEGQLNAQEDSKKENIENSSNESVLRPPLTKRLFNSMDVSDSVPDDSEQQIDRIAGTKHKSETALTPYQPKKRSRVAVSSSYSTAEDDSLLKAVMAKQSKHNVESSGRPILKRKLRSEDEQISGEVLKTWLEDSGLKRRKIIVNFPGTDSNELNSIPCAKIPFQTPLSIDVSSKGGNAGFTFVGNLGPEINPSSDKAPSVTFSLPTFTPTTSTTTDNTLQKPAVAFVALPTSTGPGKDASDEGNEKAKPLSLSAPAAAASNVSGFTFGVNTAPASVSSEAGDKLQQSTSANQFSFSTPAPTSSSITPALSTDFSSQSKSPIAGTPRRPPLSASSSGNIQVATIPFGIAFNDKVGSENPTAPSFSGVSSAAPAPVTTASAAPVAVSFPTAPTATPASATFPSAVAPVTGATSGFSFLPAANTSEPSAVSNLGTVASNSTNAGVSSVSQATMPSNPFGAPSLAASGASSNSLSGFAPPAAPSQTAAATNPFGASFPAAASSVSTAFGTPAAPANPVSAPVNIASQSGAPAVGANNLATSTHVTSSLPVFGSMAPSSSNNPFEAPAATVTSQTTPTLVAGSLPSFGSSAVSSNPFGAGINTSSSSNGQIFATPAGNVSNPFSVTTSATANPFSTPIMTSTVSGATASNSFGNVRPGATSTLPHAAPTNMTNPFLNKGSSTTPNFGNPAPIAGNSNVGFGVTNAFPPATNPSAFPATNSFAPAATTNANAFGTFPSSAANLSMTNPFANKATGPVNAGFSLSSQPVNSLGGGAAQSNAPPSFNFGNAAPASSMGSFGAPPSSSIPGPSNFVSVPSIGSVNGNPFATAGGQKKL